MVLIFLSFDITLQARKSAEEFIPIVKCWVVSQMVLIFCILTYDVLEDHSDWSNTFWASAPHEQLKGAATLEAPEST